MEKLTLKPLVSARICVCNLRYGLFSLELAREDEGGDYCFFFERQRQTPEKTMGLRQSSLEFVDGFAPIFIEKYYEFVSIFPQISSLML